VAELRVYNLTRDRLLSARARLCDSFFGRLLGLMGRADVGGGVVIVPCNSIHTLFMRAAIDVLFLDAEGRVCALYPALRPWRFTRVVRGARRVVELRAGTLGATALGDQIETTPCAS
jgi:uncharacterized membrane protein (UPF0127 family)